MILVSTASSGRPQLCGRPSEAVAEQAARRQKSSNRSLSGEAKHFYHFLQRVLQVSMRVPTSMPPDCSFLRSNIHRLPMLQLLSVKIRSSIVDFPRAKKTKQKKKKPGCSNNCGVKLTFS
jgi:hypothetical protein